MADVSAEIFSAGLSGAPQQVEDLYVFSVTAVLRPTTLLYHKCEESELLQHLQNVFNINDSQHSKTIKANVPAKQSSSKSKKRRLSVSIVACYGLTAKEADKTSNPYVSILYGDEEFNTATVEKSLNPSFNENFEFDEIPQMPLMVTVWSAAPAKAKGKDKEPKFLGQVAVPSDEFAPPGRGEDRPFDLEKRSARSNVSGAVVVNVALIPELPADPLEPPAPLDRDVDHRTCHILVTRLLLDFEASRVTAERAKQYPPGGRDGYSMEEMLVSYSPSAATLHLMELYARVYEVDSMPAKLIYLGRELETCKDNIDADFTKLSLALACVFKEHLSNSARMSAMQKEHRQAIDAAIATVNADMAATLQQYKFRFPVVNRIVTGQLDLALFLVAISQKMRAATVGTRTPASALVSSCVTVCKKQVYKLLDAQAEANMGENIFARISMVADLIEDELVQDKDFYSLYFDAVEVDLELLNATTLWQWHANSTSATLKENLGQPVRDWDDFFKLYKQMKTLKARHMQALAETNPDIEKLISKIYGPLHDWFRPWVLNWLTAYDERTLTFSKRAMEADKLEPSSQSQLHSSSVVDILTLLSQEIDDIEDVGWPILEHLIEFYESFAKTNMFHAISHRVKVGHLMTTYSEWLTGHFFAWQDFFRKVFPAADPIFQFANSADDSRITSQLCIALNNVAQFLTELASKTLAPTLEQFLVFMIGSKKAKIEKTNRVLVSRKSGESRAPQSTSIVKGVDDARLKGTQKRVRQLLGKNKLAIWHKGRGANLSVGADDKAAYDQVHDAMDPLLAYLDLNFEVFSEYLYEDVFNHLLVVLWKLVLSILDKILDPNIQLEKTGKALSPQQGSLLHLVLEILGKYFIADGNGLEETLVKTDQYHELLDKMKTYSAPVTQVIWLYFETQADKVHSESTLDKPSLIYDVQYCEGTDRLHLEDRIKVFVRGATHLPALDSDGGMSARIVLQVRHPLMKEPSTESTSIVSGTTEPVFNEKKEFQVPTVTGVLHLALYHMSKKDAQFIGEAAFSLSALANDSSAVECNQPLLPQLTARANWLLDVLASRADDQDATRFVQDRRSNILGRVPGGAKVHATAGHMFRATHKNVPPSCTVCRKVILGIGKPVYECELCGTMTHKQCHTRAPKCSRAASTDA